MHHALQLAQRQLGQTWPNPSVGAVIVKDNRIIAEGATADGGRPHAETIVLDQAGKEAKNATLYVTLEPCSHHGKTPPCVDAIITSGISTCVIACGDPNPLVGGQGIAALKATGIEVIEGIMATEARKINRGFFSIIQKKRPYIAIKIASSADEKIASSPGVRTQITGKQAWEHTQHLRASFDAILTGIGTALSDDPLLTVRLSGMEHRSPVRVLLDSKHRLPENSNLRQTEKEVPLWIYTRKDDVLRDLAKRGITRLLIEAGREVNSYFLEQGLVDTLYWYQSPATIGKQGMTATHTPLKQVVDGWQITGEPLTLGEDTLTIYENPCNE